jgi:sRNA-binding regulator protein Hfq
MTKRITPDPPGTTPQGTTKLATHAASMAAVMDPVMDSVIDQPKESQSAPRKVTYARKVRSLPPAPGKRFAATLPDEHSVNRQAELFYLQKQIQLQTQMIFVLEDGAQVQGVVEWYDRHSIKVRGKLRMLIYKSAIKYLYKAGEIGSAPSQ